MTKKVFITLLITICLLALFSANMMVQAGSIIGGADNFLQQGENDYFNTFDTGKMKQTSDLMYNVLLAIGTCIAVIIAAVLGVQFITGSVEQKVKVKESLIPFVVGCVVLFGAFGIWRLVIILFK